MIRKSALLSGTLAFHDAAVDADGPVRARSSIRHESTHDGACHPGVGRCDLAIGPDILENRSNLSPADDPTAVNLGNQFGHDHWAFG